MSRPKTWISLNGKSPISLQYLAIFFDILIYLEYGDKHIHDF